MPRIYTGLISRGSKIRVAENGTPGITPGSLFGDGVTQSWGIDYRAKSSPLPEDRLHGYAFGNQPQ
jgi:hypothetical protein